MSWTPFKQLLLLCKLKQPCSKLDIITALTIYKEAAFMLLWHETFALPVALEMWWYSLHQKDLLCLRYKWCLHKETQMNCCNQVRYVKPRSCVFKAEEMGQVSGALDRECLTCRLGDCAENKAKRKKSGYEQTSRTTGYWRTCYLKHLVLSWFWLMQSPAPSLVTCIWHKRYELSAREMGSDTQFVPEDTLFKVSLSPKDIKLAKWPAKNYRK